MVRRTFIILIVFSSLFPVTVQAQEFILSGIVYDSLTTEVLSGANMVIEPDKRMFVTDDQGQFSIRVKKGTIALTISYVGYRTETRMLNIKKNLYLEINLVPGKELDELIFTDSLHREPEQQINRTIMPVEKIQSLPVILSEPDVLKALQLMPGVQSGLEGTAGIHVRGGSPDQNLILLDQVPVYNNSHLFGIFSSFNPGSLANVELYKGGFPARYGGRLSSVIDIESRTGDFKKYKAQGSIGLISSNLTVSGPVRKDKTSFMIGFRRSYLDLFTSSLSRIFSHNKNAIGYYIQDLNGKFTWEINMKQNFYINAYHSLDNGFLKNENHNFLEYIKTKTDDLQNYRLQWGNFMLSSGLRSQWSDKLQTDFLIGFNRYKYQFTENTIHSQVSDSVTSDFYKRLNDFTRVRDLLFKANGTYRPVGSHILHFGIGLTGHYFTPENLDFNSDIEEDYHIESDKINSLEGNAFVEDEIAFKNKSVLNVGLRGSAYLVNGRSYGSLEPRIMADVVLAEGWHVNASYTHMTQYLHLLSNTSIDIATDQWVPVTERVKPQRSVQGTAGILKEFNDHYTISLEGYYKKLYNVIDYKEGAQVFDPSIDWQDQVETGNGKAYGLEFFLQKKQGRFTGWLSYTLSRSFRQFDHLNSGKTFPYKYDRIHDFSVTGTYKLSHKIEISANWLFATGIAYTQPYYLYAPNRDIPNLNIYGYNGAIMYGGKNAARYPDFHRLDLSIQFKKEKKWGERAWVFSLINVYNRKNPFFVWIATDDYTRQKRLYKYSFLQMVPSVSYRFIFK